MKGLIFAIEEMAVHDGPGLRTAVFLKGCPLRCQWCHNPEGWEMRPQRVRNPNGCVQCGGCRTVCEGSCTGCGKCLYRCPRGLLRISGKWMEASALADRIRQNEFLLKEGGVTLSGGEVLMQAPFAIELLKLLSPLHRAVETSGYGREEHWREILGLLDLVYYDIKLVDPIRHRQYTGADNEPILRNLELLKASGVPFIIRIPTIAGVNDGEDDMRAVAKLISGTSSLLGAEILPYNTCAGAKYRLLGSKYAHEDFQRPSADVLARSRDILEAAGIPTIIR